MEPKNLLILMSDEHNPKVMGCAGNQIIPTPNLDALARAGTRFTSAYTTCPICVPARASFAVGKYVHQIGYWDNADAYDGAIPSWHHLLRDQGHEVVSIGKLHFRGAPGDDHGFSNEIVPMHIIDGIGDVKGLVRENIPKRKAATRWRRLAGPGESPYTVYDRDIAARAQIWLHEDAKRAHDKPWVLFVSFVAPHFPLTAPPEWYYRYADRDLPMPKQYAHERAPAPSVSRRLRARRRLRPHFRSRDDIQRALAGYYGLVSATDENIGHVLAALKQSGLDGRDARPVHQRPRRQPRRARAVGQVDVLRGVRGRAADPCGRRAFRRASSARRRSALSTSIPSSSSASVRLHPTTASVPASRWRRSPLAGVPDRAVVSEYHATTSVAGAFMLREGASSTSITWRILRSYTTCNAIRRSCTTSPATPPTRRRSPVCRRRLLEILDPEEVDARAKRRQAELLARHGGREVALARGDLGFTPAPGTEPEID